MLTFFSTEYELFCESCHYMYNVFFPIDYELFCESYQYMYNVALPKGSQSIVTHVNINEMRKPGYIWEAQD